MNGTLSRFRPFGACLFGEEKAKEIAKTNMENGVSYKHVLYRRR